MTDRAEILRQIQRLADRDGTPPGRARFTSETGITQGQWEGVFWARWRDALAEAGFPPHELNPPLDRRMVLEHLAELTERLGRYPTVNEQKIERRRTGGEFPSKGAIARLGRKQQQLEELAAFCADEDRPHISAIIEQELAQLPRTTDPGGDGDDGSDASATTHGYVYLLRDPSSGQYKIGCSASPGRREYEVGLRLPEAPELVHEIETDDMYGMERYWHHRFRDRRRRGEWFSLSSADVRTFRSRRKM